MYTTECKYSYISTSTQIENNKFLECSICHIKHITLWNVVTINVKTDKN